MIELTEWFANAQLPARPWLVLGKGPTFDRRDRFEALKDVMETFRVIMAERKRREMDPVLETIRQCQVMLDETNLGKAAAKQDAVKPAATKASGRQRKAG